MSSPPAAAPQPGREQDVSAGTRAAEQTQQSSATLPSPTAAAATVSSSTEMQLSASGDVSSSASDLSAGGDSSRDSDSRADDHSAAAASAAGASTLPSPSPSASPPSRSSSGGLSSSPPSPSSRLPFPSRRCRVYHLRGSDGQWLDWGVGWCLMGSEIPVGDPTLKQKHILVKAEKRKAESTERMEADHAPTSPLGLPSLLQPTLLALHVPAAKHWGEQHATIITLTTHADSQHAAHSRRMHQQHQIAAAAQGSAAPPADGDAPPPSLPIEEGDEIDIALSFAEPAHAAELWKYVMSFPEVQQQREEEEEQAAKDVAAEEAAEAAAAQAEINAARNNTEDTTNGAAAVDDESPAADAADTEDAEAASPQWSPGQQDDEADAALSPPVPELIGQSLGGGGLTLSNRNGAWVASEGRSSIKDADDDLDDIDELADSPAAGSHTRFYSHSRRAPPQPAPQSASTAASSSGRAVTAGQRTSLGVSVDDDDDDNAGLDDDDDVDDSPPETHADDSNFVSAHLKRLLEGGAAGSKQHAAAQRAGKSVEPALQSHGQRLAAAAASAANRAAARRGAISGALSGSDDDNDGPSPAAAAAAAAAAAEEVEEDVIFPQSLQVPTLANLPRLHAHVSNLLSPTTPTEPPSPTAAASVLSGISGGGWGSSFGSNFRRGLAAGSTQRAQQLNYSPLKKRQLFVTAITRKSAAYNRSIINGIAKRNPTKPHGDDPKATGTTETDSHASVGSPALSRLAPVSPSDLNFLENLSALLREIDHEVEIRMTRGDMPETDAATTSKASVPVDSDAHTAAQEDTPMSHTNDAVAPAAPTASAITPLVAATPSTAPLSLLLSSASLIQGVVTMLLAFASPPLLVALFDVSSVHCLRYQMFLVIAAFEYEAAEARFAKHVAATAAAGDGSSAGLPAAASGAAAYASLFRRHRGFLQSVLFKSPFPLSMTHAIDIPLFAQVASAQTQRPGELPPLSAPPTRFGLQLVASYLVSYCRDTFLYSPRQLDDPLLLLMNQQVVHKLNHALVQLMLTDGDAPPSMATAWMGTVQRKLKRKTTGPPKEKWTAHIFAQIRRHIHEFEQQQQAESPVPAPVASPDLAPSSAPTPVPAAVYSLVSRVSADWCDLLPLGFCATLSDYMYALHNLFALTKNGNNPNGVLPQQKHDFFRKLLSEGVVECLEMVLQFCQRQQRGAHEHGDAIVGASVGPPPALSSQLSAPATVSWLRVLCVDMLATLQAVCPGFLRTFMDQQYLHAAKFAAPAPEPFVNSHVRGRGKRAKKSDADAQREWEESVDAMHAHMAQITPASCQHSLLILLFNLIADNACYVGIRQSASSFLRLVLDPEQGRAPSEHGGRRLLGGFESPVDGASGCNPLVYLLALGGVGSSAPKQMQIDSDSEQDAEADDDSDGTWPASGTRLSAAAMQAHTKEKRKAEEEAARRRLLLKQQKISKQRMVTSDPLIHFSYTHPHAMPAVVEFIKGACSAWTSLVSSPLPNPSHQLSLFLRAYPSPLLTDVLDFLSFFSLRHSLVFRRFALASHLVEAIAELFPRPVLSEQEEAQRQERERAQPSSKQATQQSTQPNGASELVSPAVACMADASAAAALPVAGVGSLASAPSPSPDLAVVAHSPSPSPAPAPGSLPVSASAGGLPPALVDFRAPTAPVLPTPILCAAMRFVRICAEIDEAFHTPILHSSLMLRLLELFLSNLRPNLLHSSILEFFTFVDSSAILPLCGQMLHGNLYTMQLRQSALRRVQRYHQAKTQRDLRALLRRAVPGATPQQTDDAVKQIHRVMEHTKAEGGDPNAAGSQEATRIIETLKAKLMGATPEQAAAAAHNATTPVTLPVPSPSPEAPSSLHASLADLGDGAPLPFLSAAYGVMRVQHLPAWPTRRFKFIRIRGAKRDSGETHSEAATTSTPALSGHKRGRDEAEDEDELPPAPPSFGGIAPVVSAPANGEEADGSESPDESPEDRVRHKKLKLKNNTAAAASYSGTDTLEAGSSLPASSSGAAPSGSGDSCSDASSDSDGLSGSSVDLEDLGSDSSDSPPPPPARAGLFRGGGRSSFGFEQDDDDENAIMAVGSDEEDDDDETPTRQRRRAGGGGAPSKSTWSSASPSADGDDSFFAHWPDEEDDTHTGTAHQQSGAGRRGEGQQGAQPTPAETAPSVSATASSVSAHAAAVQHFALYADDGEEADPSSSSSVSSRPAASSPPVPSSSLALSSPSSVSALDARLAAFESAHRLARESAQQEEHKNDAFQRLANKNRDKKEETNRTQEPAGTSSASWLSVAPTPAPAAALASVAPRSQGIAFSLGAQKQKQTPAAKTLALFATNTQPKSVSVSDTATPITDDSNAEQHGK